LLLIVTEQGTKVNGVLVAVRRKTQFLLGQFHRAPSVALRKIGDASRRPRRGTHGLW
jgi:hypothetical protein